MLGRSAREQYPKLLFKYCKKIIYELCSSFNRIWTRTRSPSQRTTVVDGLQPWNSTPNVLSVLSQFKYGLEHRHSSIKVQMPEDLGFTYRLSKSGMVHISRFGTEITVLRGDVALAFIEDTNGATLLEEQQLMARVTGNYKHGNERLAAQHPRNRR